MRLTGPREINACSSTRRKCLRYLNQLFQSTEQNSQYFTIWFGVFDRRHGQLRYAWPVILQPCCEPRA